LSILIDTARNSLSRLNSYCKNHNWVGFDPFDGLNSRVFQACPFFKNHKLCRLVFLQLNKKSSVNFRPFLNIKKGRNPKAIGLFLSGMVKLYRKEKKKEYMDLIEQFVKWLKEDSSPGYSGNCWGYNFDWQSRAFFLPKGTPTVVNTSFIGRAFLDAYEVLGNEEYLEIARSACDFILNDLNRVEENGSICFSYSPLDQYFVHNATVLASSLLSLLYAKTGEKGLRETARKSVQYVINHQQDNGGWFYGESKTAMGVGIDNFHTGFVLESLKIFTESTGDENYVDGLRKGLIFYQDNFFLKHGEPKYYFNKIYPLDIHSAAQAVVTLSQLKKYGADMELCKKVLNWMITNMQDKKGYFYYQKRRFCKIKIPYMRWSQAWAFLALSTYLLSHEK